MPLGCQNGTPGEYSENEKRSSWGPSLRWSRSSSSTRRSPSTTLALLRQRAASTSPRGTSFQRSDPTDPGDAARVREASPELDREPRGEEPGVSARRRAREGHERESKPG